MPPERRYGGPLQAVILDWAGTTIDYGSRAPTAVFIELFRRHGIDITVEQARGPMGVHKREHIKQLLALPDVAAAWRDGHGADARAADINALYEEFVPLQMDVLPRHCDVILGVLDAVAAFRRRGLKIGATTGYNREMMEIVSAEAKRQAYEPDVAVNVDDVPEGRPSPFMALRAMIELGVYPAEACLKIGDTVPDIDEGLNGGMWTVAVAKTGNELGLSEAEADALAPNILAERLAAARERLAAAGAHYVTDSVAEVPELLDEIERRLAAGERP